MKTFNLAIVYHKVRNSWRNDIEEYLEKNWDKYIKPVSDIKLKITAIESVSDEQVRLKIFKNYSNGTPAYGSINGKDITRQAVTTDDMGKFHMVLFAHDAEQSDLWDTLYDSRGRSKGNGEVTSWSFFNELYIDTEYTELEVNDRPAEGLKKAKTSALHELMHALAKRANRDGRNVVDHMDSTVVNGKVVEYYKNSFPFTKDGNYMRTLNAITEANAWDAVADMVRYEKYVELLAQIKEKQEQQTSVATPQPVAIKQTNFPDKIIVHHTGGTDKDPLADTSHHTAAIVRDWHVNGLGWSDIGYHWFIEKDGKIVQGRDEKLQGAHAIGENTRSVGICLAGNFDATLPTDAQKKSLAHLLEEVMGRYSLKASDIYPHRVFASKTCYGNKLSDTWARDLIAPQVEEPKQEPTCKPFSEYTLEEAVSAIKQLIEVLKVRLGK